eukprot:TRINITY_DN831_c0_g1_i2.p1 TRINITY_DN831_c0_g1~~TRINITY_DN831_c0_g1_i2.p1  ORF type:complete len:529 (+),score=126.04 TRINITY_DN831_c0_g1_i2:79-1587(+)
MAGIQAQITGAAVGRHGAAVAVDASRRRFHILISDGQLFFTQVYTFEQGKAWHIYGAFTPCVHKREIFWHVDTPEVELWCFLQGADLRLCGRRKGNKWSAVVVQRVSTGISVNVDDIVWHQRLDEICSVRRAAEPGQVLLDVHTKPGMPRFLQWLGWRTRIWCERPITHINGVRVADVQEAQAELSKILGKGWDGPLSIEYSCHDQRLEECDLLASACRAKGCRPPAEWDLQESARQFRDAGDPIVVYDLRTAEGLAGQMDAHGREKDPTFAELTCAVCTTHALKNPASTICCGHLFHRHCIERAMQKGAPCPMCQRGPEPGKERIAGAPVYVERALGKALVKCPQECDKLLPISDLEEHIMARDGCSNTPQLCQHSGCGEVFKRPRAEEHAASCKHARVDCADCGGSVKRDQFQQHQESVCPRRPAPCKHCQAAVPRGDMEQHFRAACTGSVPVQVVFPMREALAKSNVPAHWEVRFVAAEDRWRYSHRITGAAQWEKPEE